MGTGPTNYQVQQLLEQLTQPAKESKLWKRIFKDLNKPSRQRRIVNLYKIEQHARDGETILVPGKVLSVGEINKKIDVAALSFSSAAKVKITKANGRALSINELLKQNPEGKKIRILG